MRDAGGVARVSRRDAIRGAMGMAACAMLAGAHAPTRREPRGTSPLPCPVSRPGDPGHARFCTSWNGCFRAAPALVAHVRDAGDVAAALRFARDEGLAVAVRSGGHSFAGASVCDGVVIDVASMSGVAPTDRPGVVAAGGGVRVGALETALYRRFGGSTVTLGSCGSVGVSGLLLGGGFSAMSRVHGLTIDALDEVEAVLADGTVVVANDRSNADLFWALRGGGAGFAVVTRMLFRVRPWRQAHAVTQHWAWTAGARVLERWSGWIESLPEGASASLVWMTSGDARSSDVRTIVRTERGEAAARRVAASLAEAMGTAPRRTREWSTDAPAARGAEPANGPRTANASAFAEASIGAGAAGTMAEAFRARRGGADAGSSGTNAGAEGTAMLLCNAFGGAVAKVAPDATAFAHRRARFLAEFAAEWPSDRPDLDAANRAWVRSTSDAVRSSFGPGSYVNYADPGLRDWRAAYWGANLARLEGIKRAVDPRGALAAKVAV